MVIAPMNRSTRTHIRSIRDKRGEKPQYAPIKIAAVKARGKITVHTKATSHTPFEFIFVLSSLPSPSSRAFRGNKGDPHTAEHNCTIASAFQRCADQGKNQNLDS